MRRREANAGEARGVRPGDGCGCCSLGEAIERRAFLRDATLVVAGILTALGAPSTAAALPVRIGSAVNAREDERSYPIPATDGATIDREESIIVVRWQGSVYVFSLACPHQNTALKWAPQDAQFQCPKHHSKYRPDGSFIEGRATRGMDRFAVRRAGDTVVVDLDKLYQQDKDAAEWKAALVQV
jgi:Rieske Fe-S protein